MARNCLGSLASITREYHLSCIQKVDHVKSSTNAPGQSPLAVPGVPPRSARYQMALGWSRFDICIGTQPYTEEQQPGNHVVDGMLALASVSGRRKVYAFECRVSHSSTQDWAGGSESARRSPLKQHFMQAINSPVYLCHCHRKNCGGLPGASLCTFGAAVPWSVAKQ